MSVQLLAPIAVGPTTARNRILFGPHETNLGRGRALSDRHVAYYRRRAAGGVGTIVVEEASVHPGDWPTERAPLASECAAGWRAIADACHAEGALVVAALGHSGMQGTSHWSQRELWAPSSQPVVTGSEVPKSMEPADIAAVVAGFASAAGLAIVSGCDGVEINAGQNSLVRQFLSGLTNGRGDEWGSDRLLFARQVLTAVRAAISNEASLTLRLSCDELAPWAGLTPELAAQVATELAPLLDAVVVVRGSIFSTSATRPDGHTQPGFNLDLAAQIRAAVDLPVFAQGSLVEWGQAEWAVGDGAKCDGVEMTRALIADAELPAKLERGDAERIRPCILCNQTCLVRDNRNPPITCVVDPWSGHEYHEADPTGEGATTPTDLTIIGGGPAGMEAARVAASRGHQVTLVERNDHLGGTTRTAAAGSGRERLAAIVDWQAAELERLGVTIELSAPPARLAGVGDSTIVATGSLPGRVEYSVTKAAVRLTAAELLEGAELPVGAVLVWDPIGGPIGVSVAETLANQGRSVIIATPDNIIGNELSRSGDLAPCNVRLQVAGVTIHHRTLLRAVKKGSVEVEDRFSGERRSIACAVVVDAGARLPEGETWRALAVDHPATLRAGDSVAPRTILEAILEGRRAALAIEGVGTVSDGVPMGVQRHG